MLICKPVEEQELLPFLSRGGEKKCYSHNVFSDVISIPAYYNGLGYRKLSQRLHVLLLGTVVSYTVISTIYWSSQLYAFVYVTCYKLQGMLPI